MCPCSVPIHCLADVSLPVFPPPGSHGVNNVTEIPKKRKEDIYCGACQSSVDKNKLTKRTGEDTLSVQEIHTAPSKKSQEDTELSASETTASKIVLKRHEMQKSSKDSTSGE